MEHIFDLVVAGGGPGGYTAAIRASQLGLKVAVVEEKEMGGTCLNRGCIPTKALLHAAEIFHTARHCGDFGISATGVEFDYGRMAKRKDSIVRQLRSGVESLVRSNGIVCISGKASIKDKNTIEVSGKDNITVTAGKIIVATGSRPSKLPVRGAGDERILDSDKVLELTQCPDKVVIIGGGVIGAEFATLFNMLGKDVSIIEMMDTLVPGMDPEISAALRRSLESRGVRIFTGSRVTDITSGRTAVCSFETGGKAQTAEGDIIIAATGRKPNSENLGLEKAGVVVEKGFIKVNDRMETSVKGIYAIGDVTGKGMLAHTASAQGLVAAANAAGGDKTMQYGMIPGCIYTSPEIAAVGMTEQEAAAKNIRFAAGRFPVSANGKSMIMGEREGVAKILADPDTGEILGAHIMAPRATDMIGEICAAMKLESTVEELSDTVHPHPTVSEIIMEASWDVMGQSIHKIHKTAG